MSESNTFDKASHKNKGGLWQYIITSLKIFRHKIKAGKGNVIKHNADFWLTDNAILEIGNNCVIQDYCIS